jgi:membrane-bound serine protease (ClpP class)
MEMTALAQAPAGQVVMILEICGVINPIVAQYVTYNLTSANHTDTPLVVLLLDTPGGLDTTMRELVQAILNSDNLIVLFVEPSRVCAASAEVFITMAPGTNIGAAPPLALGDQGKPLTRLEDNLALFPR